MALPPPQALRSHSEARSAMRASHPSGRLFMNEPSQVASWYDSGIRLLAAEAKACSETEPDTLSSANEPNLPPATLPLSAAVVSWFDSGTRLVGTELGTELVEEPAVSPPEQVMLEVSMDVVRLPPPPPTPMPSPPPSGNMETPVVAPSLLDALLPWGVKAAEMVDAVFRPVAEQATQVVDVRLSEALVPSRLAAADRVEKLKFVVPRYVLAVAQLAYEDATAALAEVWTPEAHEKAQRAAAELVAVSKGLVEKGIGQAKQIAETLAEQMKEKQLAEQASSRADASRQAADRINYLKTREAELQTLIAQELAAAEEGAPELAAAVDEVSMVAAGLAVVERRNRMASALAQKRKALLLKREGRSAILRREGIANYGVAKAAEIAATKKAAVASKEEERLLAEQNEAGRIAAEAVAAAEAERFSAEQAEAERVAADQSERLAAESAAADAEAARMATAAQAEVERLAAEQAEAELRAADAEAARMSAEDEKHRVTAQKCEAEKVEGEKMGAEKVGAESAQAGTVQEEGWSVQAAAEKAEAKRLAARMRTPNGVVILGGDNLPGFTTGNTWS